MFCLSTATKAKECLSFEETAHRFGISISSVSRWAKRLEPCQTRNKPAAKIAPDYLIRDVEWNSIPTHISMSVRNGSDAVSAAYVRR